jgi:hypothetical protein
MEIAAVACSMHCSNIRLQELRKITKALNVVIIADIGTWDLPNAGYSTATFGEPKKGIRFLPVLLLI